MNHVLAFLAFAVFAVFLLILCYEVPSPDLMAAVGLTLVLALVDFIKGLSASRK